MRAVLDFVADRPVELPRTAADALGGHLAPSAVPVAPNLDGTTAAAESDDGLWSDAPLTDARREELVAMLDAASCPTSAPSSSSDRTLPRFASVGSGQGDRNRRKNGGASDVEAELHHVAVAGDVVLALEADLAELLGLGPRADVEQLVPVGSPRRG